MDVRPLQLGGPDHQLRGPDLDNTYVKANDVTINCDDETNTSKSSVMKQREERTQGYFSGYAIYADILQKYAVENV